MPTNALILRISRNSKNIRVSRSQTSSCKHDQLATLRLWHHTLSQKNGFLRTAVISTVSPFASLICWAIQSTQRFKIRHLEHSPRKIRVSFLFFIGDKLDPAAITLELWSRNIFNIFFHGVILSSLLKIDPYFLMKSSRIGVKTSHRTPASRHSHP